MGHAHAATNRYVPALHATVPVENGYEAEVVREHIDVVRRRHCNHGLEFPGQIGLAVDRLDHLLLAADNALAVEPDFAICGRAWRQMVRDCARELERGAVRT